MSAMFDYSDSQLLSYKRRQEDYFYNDINEMELLRNLPMAILTHNKNNISNNNTIISDASNITNFVHNTFSNDEDNFAKIYHDIQKIVAILVPIFFGVIAVTGFFGNTLVILVVLLNQQMQSTTNLLIVNLAVADLLFVVFCIPFTATDYVAEFWPFGGIWCRTVQYLIVVSVVASIYNLVFMSIDRFLAVVHPIRSRMFRTEKITKIAIATLWVIILTSSFPVIVSHGVVYYTENNVTLVMCQFIDNEYVSQTTYQVIFFTFSYLLPLMIISGLYLRMIMRLWRQGIGVTMSIESKRGRKRVTRLVVVVVIAFASLWLPVQIILLLKALNLYRANTKFRVILQVVAQTLAYTSSCINPLLYAFLSDNFRKAFHKAIHCSKKYNSYTADLPPPRRTSCARTSTTNV